MQNKNLLIILAIVGILLVGLWWKSVSLSSVNTNSGDGAISLKTNPDPLRPGPATFMINVKDKNGKPVDSATVSFDLNMTAMNMGTQRGNATSQGNGVYAATGQMSMRGPWKVATKVFMPDGSVVSKDFTVNVP